MECLLRARWPSQKPPEAGVRVRPAAGEARESGMYGVREPLIPPKDKYLLFYLFFSFLVGRFLTPGQRYRESVFQDSKHGR